MKERKTYFRFCKRCDCIFKPYSKFIYICDDCNLNNIRDRKNKNKRLKQKRERGAKR